MICEKLEYCPFFNKHAKENPVACYSFTLRFCKGPERHACARDEFYKMHGVKPHDDMTPLGDLLEPQAPQDPPDVALLDTSRHPCKHGHEGLANAP